MLCASGAVPVVGVSVFWIPRYHGPPQWLLERAGPATLRCSFPLRFGRGYVRLQFWVLVFCLSRVLVISSRGLYVVWSLRPSRPDPCKSKFREKRKAHKHKLFALVNVQTGLGKQLVVPGLTGPKSLCVRLGNTGNINFALCLTGGLSQGCPDFQKV